MTFDDDDEYFNDPRVQELESRIESALRALSMDARSSVRVAMAREYLNGNEPVKCPANCTGFSHIKSCPLWVLPY